MKGFHSKFHQNRIIDPDFRIFVGNWGNFKQFSYQFADRISTLFSEMLVGNDLIFSFKI